MNVPACSAAAIRNWPAGAVTSRPSMVKVTDAPASTLGAMPWCDVTTGSAMRTAPFLDVHEEVVAKHPDPRRDRRRDGRPQDADRRLLRRPRHPRGQVVAHVHEEVDVRLAPVTVLDAPQDLLQPSAPLTTRRALATRLAPEEAGDPPRGAHHARGVVHHDDGPRPEHRPGVAHLVLPEGEIEVLGPEPRG